MHKFLRLATAATVALLVLACALTALAQGQESTVHLKPGQESQPVMLQADEEIAVTQATTETIGEFRSPYGFNAVWVTQTVASVFDPSDNLAKAKVRWTLRTVGTTAHAETNQAISVVFTAAEESDVTFVIKKRIAASKTPVPVPVKSVGSWQTITVTDQFGDKFLLQAGDMVKVDVMTTAVDVELKAVSPQLFAAQSFAGIKAGASRNDLTGQYVLTQNWDYSFRNIPITFDAYPGQVISLLVRIVKAPESKTQIRILLSAKPAPAAEPLPQTGLVETGSGLERILGFLIQVAEAVRKAFGG